MQIHNICCNYKRKVIIRQWRFLCFNFKLELGPFSLLEVLSLQRWTSLFHYSLTLGFGFRRNKQQNSCLLSVALSTITHMSHYSVAPSYLKSLSKRLSFCTVTQEDLSFDMLTSSSQPESTLLLFSLPLLPVTSPISCFLCSSWHCTWQLSALCPLPSQLPSPPVYKQITL